MSKFILGSGLIGLAARHILGSSYKILPFKKSRYFSYDVPLSDNTIVSHESVREFLLGLGLPISDRYFPTAVSYCGQLIFNKHVWINTVVSKIYKEQHGFASQLLATEHAVYNYTAKQLYEHLLSMYAHEIAETQKSAVTSIGDDNITIDGTKTSHDGIISTIPLNALMELRGESHNLKSADYSVFLIGTNAFDLEGAERCFIGDEAIPFWKVNIIGPNVYQFFANGPVEGPQMVFNLMTGGKYTILANTVVPEAFPLGEPPNALLDDLSNCNIICVGSNARWDYFYDVSTCLRALLGL